MTSKPACLCAKCAVDEMITRARDIERIRNPKMGDGGPMALLMTAAVTLYTDDGSEFKDDLPFLLKLVTDIHAILQTRQSPTTNRSRTN